MTNVNFNITEEQTQFGHGRDATSEEFFATLAKILNKHGMDAEFDWDSGEFVFHDVESDIQLRAEIEGGE
jgi:hypothetical protein